MNFDIIKNTDETNSGKNKFTKIIIVAVIGAILLLAFGKTGEKKETPAETSANSFDFALYKEELREET
ncbi:MAG: hypothetical protein IKC07_01420, partial [Clostridia bacterium]|nr:hypothetical protein [Clostridia bacterium]